MYSICLDTYCFRLFSVITGYSGQLCWIKDVSSICCFEIEHDFHRSEGAGYNITHTHTSKLPLEFFSLKINIVHCCKYYSTNRCFQFIMASPNFLGLMHPFHQCNFIRTRVYIGTVPGPASAEKQKIKGQILYLRAKTYCKSNA